jgi:uncharacterized tellurite resistance protein B-like protein
MPAGGNVNDQLRKDVCRVIAGILIADYDLDAKEDEFLDRLFRQMRLPDIERSSVQPVQSKSEAAAMMRRLPPDAQDLAFTLLLEAAVVDGTVSDDEREYVYTIADELGISQKEVDEKIDLHLRANL